MLGRQESQEDRADRPSVSTYCSRDTDLAGHSGFQLHLQVKFKVKQSDTCFLMGFLKRLTIFLMQKSNQPLGSSYKLYSNQPKGFWRGGENYNLVMSVLFGGWILQRFVCICTHLKENKVITNTDTSRATSKTELIWEDPDVLLLPRTCPFLTSGALSILI